VVDAAGADADENDAQSHFFRENPYLSWTGSFSSFSGNILIDLVLIMNKIARSCVWPPFNDPWGISTSLWLPYWSWSLPLMKKLELQLASFEKITTRRKTIKKASEQNRDAAIFKYQDTLEKYRIHPKAFTIDVQLQIVAPSTSKT
jgi:hypothetical protein